MPKLFYMPFYTGDWLKDPKLRKCSLAAKGAWIDLLSTMWEDGQSGELTGTTKQLARICGESVDEFVSAICELNDNGVATIEPEVSADPGQVLRLTCRRMKSLFSDRVTKTENKPKKDSRKKQEQVNKNSESITITINSDSSGSASGGESEGNQELPGMPPPWAPDFEALYARYPKKEGRKKGEAKFEAEITTPAKEELAHLSLTNYLHKLQVESITWQYTMKFSTWMNNWEDYVSYQPPLSAPPSAERQYKNFAAPRKPILDTDPPEEF